MSFTASTVNGARIQVDTGLLGQPILEVGFRRIFAVSLGHFFCADSIQHLAEVQKRHESPFVTGVADVGHVLLDIVFDEGMVVIHVGIGLVEPLPAVVIGRLVGHYTQGAEFGAVELIHLCQQPGILGVIIGVLQQDL